MTDVFDPSLKGVDLQQEDLSELYQHMQRAPLQAAGIWFRKRGYGLELLLQEALRRESLEPRAPYRPDGEQIDGSFSLEGRVYLMEAKWVADPLPASTVYAFKGKVAGKLIGTIGFLISVSGFGADTVDAVCLGKTLDVLLVDGSDLESAFSGHVSFTQLFRRKIRVAAEDGIVYLPPQGVIQAAIAGAQSSEINSPETIDWSPDGRLPASLVVITEDQESLRAARAFLDLVAGRRDTVLLAAGGSVAAVRLSRAVNRAARGSTPILVIANTENLQEKEEIPLPPTVHVLEEGRMRLWLASLEALAPSSRPSWISWLTSTGDQRFTELKSWLDTHQPDLSNETRSFK